MNPIPPLMMTTLAAWASAMTCGCTPSAAAPAERAPGAAPGTATSTVRQPRAATPSGQAAATPTTAASAARPWLDVVLPAEPARGAASARAVFALHDSEVAPSAYAGVRLRVGAAAPRLVPLGARAEVRLVASRTRPLRFDVGDVHVLAYAYPGDRLTLLGTPDGGWVAKIKDRVPESAPKKLTTCAAAADDCPVGYLPTPTYAGDRVCPPPASEDVGLKCVKAPVVRGRGPLVDAGEVAEASASGRFDDLDALPLGPVATGAVGPWRAVNLGGDAMPRVRLGAAEAFVLMGPGEAWQVWVGADGQLDAERVPAPK
ncbi:MAG: hypothetical protein R3B48_02710 [Kofleriaceae bacterium]